MNSPFPPEARMVMLKTLGERGVPLFFANVAVSYFIEFLTMLKRDLESQGCSFE